MPVLLQRRCATSGGSSAALSVGPAAKAVIRFLDLLGPEGPSALFEAVYFNWQFGLCRSLDDCISNLSPREATSGECIQKCLRQRTSLNDCRRFRRLSNQAVDFFQQSFPQPFLFEVVRTCDMFRRDRFPRLVNTSHTLPLDN